MIISQYGLILNLRKKTLKYTSNLLIVEDRTHRRIINGKVSSAKANGELSRKWPFHIIRSRKTEPVNHGYAEQAFPNR